MAKETINIGGACGYWGDAAVGTPQLLASESLDFLVYDYLAEITMSILARARKADETKGYATDFMKVMATNLDEIARQGVKVISNAGGINPQACASALQELIEQHNLSLKVAVVLGDNLAGKATDFQASNAKEMFSGEAFPAAEKVASINAYLGAFPIAKALDEGADIVLTGRCVDSAVTLGACIHSFGWNTEDFDQLAQGSLAGHLLECGTQVTGGNFTDWEALNGSFADLGYPIASVRKNGDFDLGKPKGTSGIVNVGTVAEQMLYEVGDPQAYIVPDVVCDFSSVKLEQKADDCVTVTGAIGHGAPATYKASATWSDGFKSGQIWTMYGRDADTKARLFADTVFERANRVITAQGMPPLSQTSVEIIGAESHFGAAARCDDVREVDVKVAAKHPEAKAINIFLKEMSGLALGAPPGLTGFAGARAKASPVVRLFSLLVAKEQVPVSVEFENKQQAIDVYRPDETPPKPDQHTIPPIDLSGDRVEVPLEQLAWGRSGDKGNKANIGIIARKAEYLPYIAAVLTPERVATYFAHFRDDASPGQVERFYLPGIHALNFLLSNVLGGGGVASLRNDPQGKGFAQLLLTETIPVPETLLN